MSTAWVAVSLGTIVSASGVPVGVNVVVGMLDAVTVGVIVLVSVAVGELVGVSVASGVCKIAYI